MTDWEEGDIGFILHYRSIYGNGPHLAHLYNGPEFIYFTHLDGSRIKTSPHGLPGPVYGVNQTGDIHKDEFLTALRRAKHAKPD